MTLEMAARILRVSPKTVYKYKTLMESDFKIRLHKTDGNGNYWGANLVGLILAIHVKSTLNCTLEAAIRVILNSLAKGLPLPSYPEGFGPGEYEKHLAEPTEPTPAVNSLEARLEALERENAALRKTLEEMKALQSRVQLYGEIFAEMEITKVEDLHYMNVRELLTEKFGYWEEMVQAAVTDAKVIRAFVKEEYQHLLEQINALEGQLMKEDQMREHFQRLEADRSTMLRTVEAAKNSQKELEVNLKAFLAYLDEAIPSKRVSFAAILNQVRFGLR